MHAETHVPPVDPWALDEAERVALSYHRAAGGDAWIALVRLATDALADHDAIERRLRTTEASVSRGYVRAQWPVPARP